MKREALTEVWKRGRVGEKYNIGGQSEISNIELIKEILVILEKRSMFLIDQDMTKDILLTSLR